MLGRGDIDLVAYDKEGRIVLLAEAKSRRGTSENWAAQLRRNMLAHGTLPGTKLFLIATPERMYLWKHQPAGKPEAPPEFTADAQKVLEPYFEKLCQEPSEIGPEAFEFLVLTWLIDIARAGHTELHPDTSSEFLSELTGSLQQARIEMHSVQ